jgi:hypothetical protein
VSSSLPLAAAVTRNGQNSPLHSAVSADFAPPAIPPIPLAQLQAAEKKRKGCHSRPLTPFSQGSQSARESTRGSGKGHALPHVVAVFHEIVMRVQQKETEANALLCDGDVTDALKALNVAVQTAQESALLGLSCKGGSSSHSSSSHAVGATLAGTAVAAPLPESAASLRSASSTSSSSCAAAVTAVSFGQATVWRTDVSQRLAATYTLVATNAGVRCGETVEPLAVQKAYFQAAMRFLVESEDEELFPEWKRSTQRINSSGVSRATSHRSSAVKKASKVSQQNPAFTLADGTEFHAVRRLLLRCAVRNNATVCLADRSSRGGRARTIYELLKTLAEVSGVWGVVVLYNLAVAFSAVDHYDDAVEAIARCMELSYFYLQAAEITEHQQRGTPFEPSAAAHVIHTLMALQLIRNHHFIATLAAWCDPAGGMEVQHCEMALGCARQYLPSTDARLRECQRRLTAAHGRGAGAFSTMTAPLLPYVTQDYCFASCEPPSGSTATTMSGGVAGGVDINCLVTGLLSLSSATSPTLAAALPPEVQAYVQATQKGDALNFWVQEAQQHGASPPPLSAAKALAPLSALFAPPSRLVHSPVDGALGSGDASHRERLKTASSHRDKSLRTKQGAPSPLSSALPPSPTGTRLTEASNCSAPSADQLSVVYRPSKPAPYFVTTLPHGTFRRYCNLRASVLAQLASEEVAAPPPTIMERDSAENAAMNCSAATLEPKSPSDEGLPNAHGSAPDRGRRVTMLLHGAATTPAAAEALSAEQQKRKSTTPRSDTDAATEESHEAGTALVTVRGTSDALVTPVRPSELLRQLDVKAETCYSRLVADPLADAQRHAALRLQAWWRARGAKYDRTRRGEAVALRCEAEAQVHRIQRAFREWRQRRLRAAQRERVHQARCREEEVSVVQAFLRHRQSLELWGQACVAWYRQLLLEQEGKRREYAATVVLQSWWRMCLAQAAVRTVMNAVLRVQALWRGARVRNELRRQRVHRQLAEETRYQRGATHLVRLQRWWRGCRACGVARESVTERQQAVAAYLTDMETSHDDAMRTHTRDSEGSTDAVASMRVVLAVLSGARDRRGLGSMYHYAQIRQRAIHRYVLLHRGRDERMRLRRAREDRLRVERRHEEVVAATLRLQKWARQWIPRCRVNNSRMLTLVQNKAATAIQVTWRAQHARQQREAFSRFMSHDRHEYVARIQRAWRALHAHSAKLHQRGAIVEREAATVETLLERQHTAATRIQAWYRLQRRRSPLHKKHDAERTAAPPLTYDAAARRIQTCWRSYAAKSSRRQLFSEGELVATQTLSANAVHAYTTWIQSFARSLLACRAVRALPRTPQTVGSTTVRSQLSASSQSCRVPQPPAVPPGPCTVKGFELIQADTDAAADAVTDVGTGTSRRGSPTLPGFCHATATSSPSMTPKTFDPAHHSPSWSALPQSLSRLTGSADKPLYFYSGATYEPYGAGVTQRFSSSSESEYSEEDTEESQEEEVEGVEEEEGYCEEEEMSAHSESANSASRTRNTEGEETVEDEEKLLVFHQLPGSWTTKGNEPPAEKTAPAAAPAFLVPRPPVSQRIMCTVRCRHTPAEIAAATHIQAVWRGFCVRCSIEYYYEEYYEEVDEDEDEGEEEEDGEYDDDSNGGDERDE